MNKLSLNFEKTYGMFFCANRKGNLVNFKPDIKFNDQQLIITDQFKYLGVIIDSKLSFKNHIYYLIDKLRKWITIFRKISPLLSFNAQKLLYYSMFYPNLLYGIEM